MEDTKFASKSPCYWRYGWTFLLLIAGYICLYGGEKNLIELRDFTNTELKGAGLILSRDTDIHINAMGGAIKKSALGNSDMYAYAWIIDADSREVIWQMEKNNTNAKNDYRVFDDVIHLKKGAYEVYFAAYAYSGGSVFSNFTINIDHRKPDEKQKSKKGFFNWIDELFGDKEKIDWKKLAKNWGITIAVDNTINGINLFKVPQEPQNLLYHATQIGDDERIRQSFTVSNPLPIRIYAIGEKDYQDELADHGWIVDLKTGRRVWSMQKSEKEYAGGDKKNIKYDGTITLQPGDYILYYNTDDSHSFADWNSAPPYDPFNYGVSLIAKNAGDAASFKLTEMKHGKENIVAELVKVGNDETRQASFTLNEEATLHIYAIGERAYSRRQLVDYGWIINAATREKVWVMEADRTDHAGGANKNRVADEMITLPAGTYTVFFQTDDSHSYNDWNEDKPFDDEHYGITIYTDEKTFKKNILYRCKNTKNLGNN
jgi:plastocyanin